MWFCRPTITLKTLMLLQYRNIFLLNEYKTDDHNLIVIRLSLFYNINDMECKAETYSRT